MTETGLTTADEMLYPENFEVVSDLVSYHAVGARSVEDQQHRFVASGIDAPVGLKNPTSGNLSIAFNALHAAQRRSGCEPHPARRKRKSCHPRNCPC